jgi:hypothetical protein
MSEPRVASDDAQIACTKTLSLLEEICCGRRCGNLYLHEKYLVISGGDSCSKWRLQLIASNEGVRCPRRPEKPDIHGAVVDCGGGMRRERGCAWAQQMTYQVDTVQLDMSGNLCVYTSVAAIVFVIDLKRSCV